MAIQSDFPVKFVWNSKEFTLFLRTNTDIAVLREIFIDLEYDWFPVESPRIIIDLGAHFGDTAIYYACRYPDAKIYALEPSPDNFNRLVSHVKTFDNIIPVQAAIGHKDGMVDFNIGTSSLGHSLAKREGSIKTIHVQQISLSTLYKDFKINYADLIKFDIEGGEFSWLSNIKITDFTKSCIGEMHFDLDKNFSVSDLDRLFTGCSFDFEQISTYRGLVRAINTNNL